MQPLLSVLAEFLHVKPGKGAAFVRTKLRNLLSNSNQEKTFRGGETVGLAEVSRREAQFTYADGDQVRRRQQHTLVNRAAASLSILPQSSRCGSCSSLACSVPTHGGRTARAAG